MPLDAPQTTQQISDAIGAMLLLNSSCQALIEASVAPSTSPWYPVVDRELGTAENLVVGWRQSGYLYFKAQILREITACGEAFGAARAPLDALFASLGPGGLDPAVQQEIETALEALEAPVAAMVGALDAYDAKLAAFQQAMTGPHDQLDQTIAQVQAQEADLQEQITVINEQITALQGQLQTDRDAIAKAEAQRTSGIVETIFGVLLTPFTGGASLILAGIGVASIAEGQEQISALQNTITASQATISQDQAGLSADQQQVTTLSGLTLSTGLVLGDIAGIDAALTALRTTWTVLTGQITAAATAVRGAQSAPDALVAQVWFDAACDGWQEILSYVAAMGTLPQPTPTHVPIGQ